VVPFEKLKNANGDVCPEETIATAPLVNSMPAREGLEAAGNLARAIDKSGLEGGPLLEALINPALPLGRGNSRTVRWPLKEEFSDYVIAERHDVKPAQGMELVFHFDPFPIGNVGQVIASFDNPDGRCAAEVMLKQIGVPLLQVQLRVAQKEPGLPVREQWERYFDLLANLPQSSFDRLARTISQVTTYGGAVDALNISNVLYDRVTQDLNLVDVAFPARNPGTPHEHSTAAFTDRGPTDPQFGGNTVNGMVCLLFDQFNYNIPSQGLRHTPGSALHTAESNLIRKVLIAAHGAELPIGENKPPLAFVFGRIAADGDSIISSYKKIRGTGEFASSPAVLQLKKPLSARV
jgi:hypothetical protein